MKFELTGRLTALINPVYLFGSPGSNLFRRCKNPLLIKNGDKSLLKNLPPPQFIENYKTSSSLSRQGLKFGFIPVTPFLSIVIGFPSKFVNEKE